jgi:hypothetical protein
MADCAAATSSALRVDGQGGGDDPSDDAAVTVSLVGRTAVVDDVVLTAATDGVGGAADDALAALVLGSAESFEQPESSAAKTTETRPAPTRLVIARPPPSPPGNPRTIHSRPRQPETCVQRHVDKPLPAGQSHDEQRRVQFAGHSHGQEGSAVYPSPHRCCRDQLRIQSAHCIGSSAALPRMINESGHFRSSCDAKWPETVITRGHPAHRHRQRHSGQGSA